MNHSNSFSGTYGEARAKFLAAASDAGASISSVPHPERGPEGDGLSTDVAWIGSPRAEKVLVLLSGTHGVEGFCGSGAQIDWLRRGEYRRLGDRGAVLLVHAVNPWGFAWLRRTTHENIDVNRNWVDFSEPVPDNPEYERLHNYLVPSEWTAAAQEHARAALEDYASKYGDRAYQEAITRGQYRHPDGLFYGGTAPSWSRRTQTEIFERFLGSARRVVLIDYHTGLGDWGYAEPICPYAENSPGAALARRVFGPGITCLHGGSSVSAPVSGDGLSRSVTLLRTDDVLAIALEFGTIAREKMFQALRADAWLHAYGDVRSDPAKPIKQAIKDAFYGDCDAWRGMILGQSLQYSRMAMARVTE